MTKQIAISSIIISVVALGLGIIVGVFYYQNKSIKKLPIQPISNPVLSSIEAEVTGTLIDKKEVSATNSGTPIPEGIYGKLVLENEGNKLEIFVGDEGLITQYYQAPAENRYLNKGQILFSDLQIGSYIEGGVSVQKLLEQESTPIIYGHVFTIYPPENKL